MSAASAFAQYVEWKHNFGGLIHDVYNSVTAVSDGIVAVGFSWSDSFGNGDWTGVTTKGDTDAIIVKYDNAGNVVWKKSFGDLLGDVFNSVIVVSDEIIAAGVSYLNSVGSINTGDWEGISGNGSEAIIVKYTESNTEIFEVFESQNIKIYPNPTNNNFSFECKNYSTIKLYNILGKEVLSQTTNGKTEINISHLSNGFYIVRVFSEDKIIGSSKVVKQ
jgi:hypothetical protein